MNHSLSWSTATNWLGSIFARPLRDRAATSKPHAPHAAPRIDPVFLRQVRRVVEDQIDNAAFSVDWLASEVCICPRQLQRRMRRATGVSAAVYIRAVRLERAARLLEEGGRSIAEVARAVSYRDARHFSRLFREAYGMSPTAYAACHASADQDEVVAGRLPVVHRGAA